MTRATSRAAPMIRTHSTKFLTGPDCFLRCRPRRLRRTTGRTGSAGASSGPSVTTVDVALADEVGAERMSSPVPVVGRLLAPITGEDPPCSLIDRFGVALNDPGV